MIGPQQAVGRWDVPVPFRHRDALVLRGAYPNRFRMKHLFRALLAPLLLVCAIGASAQPNVDIGLYDNGSGQLQVRLRPDGPFEGLVSSIVFTIRWSDASGATLGLVSQQSPESLYLPTGKSGPMQTDGGYRYQIFAGVSLVTLMDAETAWAAGEEVVLCQIPVNGSAYFEIVNDAWTGDVGHNGDYYVSLNGQNRTGVIYSISTDVSQPEAELTGLTVLPNPTEGTARLTFSVGDAEPVAVEVFDLTGRCIVKTQRASVTGLYRETIDLSSNADGVYLVKVRVGDTVHTQRLVVDHH